jgi:phosphatidylethanolamine/phosphatidyl-N-methylethanolamine N-methyltransferase
LGVSSAKEYLSFLTAFATKPFHMGAVVPSSRQLAEMMLLKFKPGDVVAEIGPGTGAMTRVLQTRLADPAHYHGFDINHEFVAGLRKSFPSLQFSQDSAENLSTHFPGVSSLDYIVCSLPWTIWPSEHQAKVLEGIVAPLKKDGYFVTFCYWPTLYAPAGQALKRLLKKTFSSVELTPVVWRNIPPAAVYICRK